MKNNIFFDWNVRIQLKIYRFWVLKKRKRWKLVFTKKRHHADFCQFEEKLAQKRYHAEFCQFEEKLAQKRHQAEFCPFEKKKLAQKRHYAEFCLLVEKLWIKPFTIF